MDASEPLATSCKQLLARGETQSGVYEIDADGVGALESRPIYCDMSFEGGGWTLVESFVAGDTPDGLGADGAGGFELDEPLPNRTGALSSAWVVVLANGATQAHVRTSFDVNDGEWITSKSTETKVMENLRALRVLNYGLQENGRTAKDYFEGPNAKDARLEYSEGCIVDARAKYPAIYWACGKGAGLHLLESWARWSYNEGANQSLNVFVR